MFIFGHIGLTIGLVLLLLITVNKTELISTLDFRIIAVFAMLPDIIDKVLGHLFFYGILNNGRLFAHTLVFLIVFSIIFYLVARTYWWLYTLPVLTHLVFDLMWQTPETLLWPTYGWGFERFDMNVWEHWSQALFGDPFVIATEIIGAIIIICVVMYFRLYIRENFVMALRAGRLKKDDK